MLSASVRRLVFRCGFGCAILASAPVAADELHPLQEALELCKSAHDQVVGSIADYEATLVKRERIEGQLRDREVMRSKVRHEKKSPTGIAVPFSVHIEFRHPESVKGREVAYVKDRNKGQ